MLDDQHDRERHALPPDLQSLHDALLAEGMTVQQEAASVERLRRHAAWLVTQDRRAVDLHAQKGKDAMTQPSAQSLPMPLPGRTTPRRARAQVIAALTFMAVIGVVLASTLYWHRALQQTTQTHPHLLYIVSNPSENNQLSPTPLTAYNAATGKTVWTFQPQGGSIVSSIVADGLVLVPIYRLSVSGSSYLSETLVALDATTGKVRWQLANQTDIVSPVTVADHVAYFGIATGMSTSALVAIRLQDGATLWQTANVAKRVTIVSAIANGMIYASSDNTCPVGFGCSGFPRTDAKGLSAIDSRSGHIVWQSDITTLDDVIDRDFLPVFANSSYVFVTRESSFAHPNIQALHASNGSVAWYGANDELIGVTGSTLLVTNKTLESLNESDGSVRWKDPPNTSTKIQSTFAFSPISFTIGEYDPGDLHSAHSSHHLEGGVITSIDTASGHLQWTKATGDGPVQLINTGGVVYALLANTLSTAGNTIYLRHTVIAFDAQTGKELWRAANTDPGLFFAEDENIILESANSAVYYLASGMFRAYSITTEKQLWSMPAPNGMQFVDLEVGP